MKIISGGQTGVDRASLDAALDLGLGCGGFCPKGRRSEDGTIPEKYPLTETTTDQYAERTGLNVQAADGTLVIIDREADKGTSLTISLCKSYDKPYLVIDLSAGTPESEIRYWIIENKIDILNVAGNRESVSQGINRRTYKFLLAIFSKLNRD